MNFIDDQGRATRAQRWPCATTWETRGCGEVLRLDEAFDHILDHHPDTGPQALVLAALAELSTTVGIAAGTQFYEWVLQLRDLTDWTPGVRGVLYGLTTIADDRDPLAEALAECTDADREQLGMLLDIRQAQHKGERFWSALAYIIDRNRSRP
jgi:hypothetical protein